MNDVRFVRSIERCQHLNTDIEYVAELWSFPLQVISQCLAVNEFSGQESQSVHFTKLEDRKYVGMV